MCAGVVSCWSPIQRFQIYAAFYLEEFVREFFVFFFPSSLLKLSSDLTLDLPWVFTRY